MLAGRVLLQGSRCRRRVRLRVLRNCGFSACSLAAGDDRTDETMFLDAPSGTFTVAREQRNPQMRRRRCVIRWGGRERVPGEEAAVEAESWSRFLSATKRWWAQTPPPRLPTLESVAVSPPLPQVKVGHGESCARYRLKDASAVC